MQPLHLPTNFWGWLSYDQYFVYNGLVQGAFLVAFILLWLLLPAIKMRRFYVPWAVVIFPIFQSSFLAIFMSSINWEYNFNPALIVFSVLLFWIFYLVLRGIYRIALQGKMPRSPMLLGVLSGLVPMVVFQSLIVLTNLSMHKLSQEKMAENLFHFAGYIVGIILVAVLFLGIKKIRKWAEYRCSRCRSKIDVGEKFCVRCQSVL